MPIPHRLIRSLSAPLALLVAASAALAQSGAPDKFNVNDQKVLDSGHQAKFNAVAIAALFGIGKIPPILPSTARLDFDGVSYEHAPRMLALSNIPSPADGNSTLLVLNRIGGDLTKGAASLGNIFLFLFDDQENPFSAAFLARTCQLTGVLSSAFPRTAPLFTTIIPSGHSGWMKLNPLTNGVGILGAAINFNPNAATDRKAFNGGDNLHHLTLTTDSLIIPLSNPSC